MAPSRYAEVIRALVGTGIAFLLIQSTLPLTEIEPYDSLLLSLIYVGWVWVIAAARMKSLRDYGVNIRLGPPVMKALVLITPAALAVSAIFASREMPVLQAYHRSDLLPWVVAWVVIGPISRGDLLSRVCSHNAVGDAPRGKQYRGAQEGVLVCRGIVLGHAHLHQSELCPRLNGL